MTTVLPEITHTARHIGYFIAVLVAVASLISGGFRAIEGVVPKSLVVTFLWLWLSLTWATMPVVAVKRLVLTTAVAGVTFICATQLGYRRSLMTLRVVLCLALFGSIVTLMLDEKVALQVSDEAKMWRGIMADKNIAGGLCATIGLLFAFDAKRIPSPVRWSIFLIALAFMIMTRSRTAWLAFFVALLAGGMHSRFTVRSIAGLSEKGRVRVKSAGKALGGIACLLFCLLIWQRDILLWLTADETMLSLRGAIWRPLMQTFLDHPLTGTGYGSYWAEASGNPDFFGGNKWLKNVNQGHNGFLDLAAQVGVVGLFLGIYSVFLAPARKLVKISVRYPERSALLTSLLCFFLLSNFTETSMLDRDTLGNVMLLLVSALLSSLMRRPLRILDDPNYKEVRRSERSQLPRAGA